MNKKVILKRNQAKIKERKAIERRLDNYLLRERTETKTEVIKSVK